MQPPRFDGSDATNWISRVEYYFNHLLMPDAHRLHYAVMLFDPPAADWVFNYCANNDFVTWQEFLEDVRHRFEPQSFQSYFALLAKLVQTGTVVEYHNTFEKYLNRIQGIPESELFTLFVAGLKPDMQERVRLHRPSSLAAAMALSLELASTQPERAQNIQSSSNTRRSWQARETRGQSGFATTQVSTPASAPPSGQQAGGSDRVAEQSRCPAIRVSQAEKAERARLGLCYFCPEKWVMGHVCKQRLLCYMDEDDGYESEPSTDDRATYNIITETAHIHSMEGGQRSRTLKVVGIIQNVEVSVLIDTGSDRDFLHPAVAEQLHLPLSSIRPFMVFVGNGQALLCTHVSKQTKLEIQGSTFLVDLHILPVHGPDVVLGMDWLESLGKVTADFAGKTLEFTHRDRPIILKGIQPPLRRVGLRSLASGCPDSEPLECYEILLLAPDETNTAQPAREEFPPDLSPATCEVLER